MLDHFPDIFFSGWNKIDPKKGPLGISYLGLKIVNKGGSTCENGAPRDNAKGICIQKHYTMSHKVLRESSGAGIYFKDKDRNNRYFLAGVVPKDESFPKAITVYVPNIAKKSLQWIRKKRKQIRNCKYKPKINEENCGKSNVVEKPNIKDELHPWQVTIYINWKKNIRKKESLETPPDSDESDDEEEEYYFEEKDLICQGVLITTQHVLTAYHCLVENERNKGVIRKL